MHAVFRKLHFCVPTTRTDHGEAVHFRGYGHIKKEVAAWASPGTRLMVWPNAR